MIFKTFILFSILVVCKSARRSQININNKKFQNLYGTIDVQLPEDDAGDPLILTDYINQNEIKKAQEESKVNSSIFLGVNSYSGYFRVDDDSNACIFFWFFPSQSNPTEDPVVLWLQGGPGSTSMFGLFQENGPIQLVGENVLELRNTSWTKSASVLYIDQPVQTGWSFTSGSIPSDQTQVGDHIYKALLQFFQLFPNLQHNEFFVTGESYGGKYIPAIAYTILKNNPSSTQKINLKGIAIGNGWSNPSYQLRYADYLLQHGLIDKATRNKMFDLEQKAVDLIDEGDFTVAKQIMDEDFGGLFSVFTKATSFTNVYNYLFEFEDSSINLWLGSFFGRADVRRAIHVGYRNFNDGGDVYDALEKDIPQSVAPWVEEILENYRVLLYNGQLDLIVPYPLTIDYIRNLTFSSAEEYKNAKREVWFVDDRIAGFAKTAGNLTEVLVRNSGHMVPQDQPEWALDLITRFIKNIPYNL